MAARYDYGAIEFKETAHRRDGVFRPKEAGLPVYFLEVQFYSRPNIYADLLVKAYTYLKDNDPGQLFRGVILFANRELEPKELTPYQPLLDAGVVRPLYLDEMPTLTQAPPGLAIMDLVRQPDDRAVIKARELIARAKQEIPDVVSRARSNLI